MKKIVLLLVIFMFAIDTFAWLPSLKYARWMPMFAIDKTWKFQSWSGDKNNNPLHGCDTVSFPGTICWAMLSWDERKAYWDDYNMRWAEVYLTDDEDRQGAKIKLCKVIPEGVNDDNGWKLKDLQQNPSAGRTYLAKEVFRSYEDGSGFLYFVTYYTDEVRQFINGVKAKGHHVGVYFTTEWDDGTWDVEHAYSRLDDKDVTFLQVPPTPTIQNVGWTVRNNKTSLEFTTSNITSTSSYSLCVEEGNGKRGVIDMSTGTFKYYTPDNMSQYKDKMHSLFSMTMQAYTVKTYTYSRDYYDSRSSQASTVATVTSSKTPFNTPVFPHPASLRINDLFNGIVSVAWTVPPTNTSIAPDTSRFILERATNSNFTADYKIYHIKYATSTAEYNYKDTFEFRDRGAAVTFYYRLRRSHSTVSELGVETSAKICTDFANLQAFSAEIDPTTRKAYFTWDYTKGIISPSEMAITVTSPQVQPVYIDVTPSKRRHDGVNVQECVSTTFNMQLYTRNVARGSARASKPVTLQQATAAVIDTLIASAGYYNDRVVLNWKANPTFNTFNSFVLSRIEYGANDTTFVTLGNVPFTAGVLNYNYTDNTCVPGVYYIYCVQGLSTCDNKPVKVTPRFAIGFAQPMGVLSGQISYSGNQASPDVAIVANGDGNYSGKSLSFVASSQPKLFVQPRFIASLFGETQGTIEFFLRLNDINQNCTILQYKDNLKLLCQNKKLVLQVKDNAGTLHSTSYDSLKNDGRFNHIAITYNTSGANRNCLLYVNGSPAQMLSFDPGNSYAITNDVTGTLCIGSNGVNSFMDGNIDEIRFWNVQRTSSQIKQFNNIYLNGTETGLTGYYRCDNDVYGILFDISKTGNTFNGRHLAISGIPFDSEQIPTPEQLCFKTYTDRNGHYLFNNIPYSHSGTQYTITPMLGVHEFSPTSRPIYFNSAASTHNSIDFTDVSSFKVSGTVYYYNTNYPVKGCSFLIDGTSSCMKDGELITTDENGNFTIDVPIGKHFITVNNGNHTFANRGRYPATGLADFDRPITGLTFSDSTFVLVTGRVSGGTDEAEKPHGFALGKATIGQARIVISPVGAIYDLNRDTLNSRTFVMPADSIHGTCRSVATTGKAVANYAKSITILTDSVTGEFNVMLPPLNFTVNSVNIIHNTGEISFSSALPALDLTERDVLNRNTDSATVDSTHYYYFKYSKALDVMYYSYPQMILVQNELGNKAIGSKTFHYSDNSTGTLIEEDVDLYTIRNDSVIYTFGYPCFFQGDIHTWMLTVAERYVNYDNRQYPDTTYQPFRYGIVNVENNFGKIIKNNFAMMDTSLTLPNSKVVSVSGNEMLLDANGRTFYSFQVGDPVTFAPYVASAQITFTDPDRTRDYDWNGNKNTQSIVFGSKMRGSRMITKGPDEVFYILRDPVGSDSYATWESGETVTKTKISYNGWQRQVDFNWDFVVGTDANMVIAPFGNGLHISGLNTENTIGPFVHYEGSSQSYTQKTWTFTNEQTISTSNDHTMVGSCADVYIGKSTNYIYGTADQITLRRDSARHYSITKKDAISLSSELGTQFNYSQYYIETFLLPDIKHIRNSLLITVPDSLYSKEKYKNTTSSAVYITKLTPNNPKYGEDSTYLQILPKNSTQKLFPDTIHGLNQQIKQWIGVMRENERAKTIVHHSNTPFNQANWETAVYGSASKEELFKAVSAPSIDSTFNTLDSISKKYSGGWLIGNYSVGAGAPFSQSQTREYSCISNGKVESNSFLVGLNGDFSFSIKKVGSEIAFSAGAGGVFSRDNSTNNQQTTTVSYNVLMDSYEALSFDVYQAPDGFGPIFSARAGQTFCPYEGEEKTKYYEPDMHTLHTATTAMAKPSMTAVNNRSINIPVGQKALFNITLGNEAATSPQMEFVLCEDAATNPNGAIIRMDGAPVTYGGVLVGLAGGASTNKVIEIEQTRQDILNYDSIRLIFKTNCYKFDADTIYLTAHFVPTCSDINLTVDKTTINNTTDTIAHFTISGYTPDFKNFKGIQLQYQREGDTQWSVLKQYGVSADTAVRHFNLKFSLPSYPNGTYKFRAVTLCQYGNDVINNESDVITITVDLTPPAALGHPYPLDGIYSQSSQIYVDFSEPIQTGRVLQDNVIAEGVLNSHQIDHAISLDLENNSAFSSATFMLDSVPFSLEMWIKYTEPGTIFTYANASANNGGFAFSIDANNKLVATINGNNVVSSNALRPDNWMYLQVQCNPGTRMMNAAYACGSDTVQLFQNITVPVVSVKGNVRFGGNGLKAKIHDVALWNIARSWATALAERSLSKSTYTPNLISLWRMNEGSGKSAADCIRHRDLALTADAWAYNYKNFALHIPARSTASVNISECPIPADQNWLFEFWFRAYGDAHLFHLANDSIRVDVRNSNLTINNASYPIRNYTDSIWHHLAIINKITAAPIVAIDGVQVSTYSLTDLPCFQSNAVVFGADSLHSPANSDIDIDEIRLWKINTSLDMVRQYRSTCLRGTEPGLVAYYPMEHTIVNAYNQNVTEFTKLDKTVADTTRAMRITLGQKASSTASSPALVESRPVENVAHTFTASDNRVVVNITEPAARIEGCTIEFTIKGIVDKNGNYSQPIRWSAFVNRNQLLWDNDVVYVVKDEQEDTTINLVIVNSGSQTKAWTIDNVPSWMTLSHTSGYIQPLQRETISCTINSSLDRGENEFVLYLLCDDNIERPLYINTKVTANKPDWTIDETNFASPMNLIAVAEINGIMADDADDMLAAFIGNELVGVANLQLLPALGRYFVMMTIYPGTNAKKNITFRYWDASNGIIYNNIALYCRTSSGTDSLINPFTFAAENVCGDINSPYLLRMGAEVEQSIDINRGWNWISINVAPFDQSLNNIWKEYFSSFDIIKSQYKFAQTDTIYSVIRGPLDTMECGKGYKLASKKNFTARITGAPAPIQTSVTIAPNRWTWIGYVPQTAMTVNEALSNINPSVGDIIKSQQKFATWDGYQWVGSLIVMEPGRGYLYKNTGKSSILFSYPDYGAISSVPLMMPAENENSYFNPIDPGEYQGNMTMTAKVTYFGIELEDAEVAIFAGSECRAVSTYSDGYYFITIPGEASVPLTIKVFYGDSIYTFSNVFSFDNDLVLGDLYDPYVIELVSESNPTSVVNVDATASDKVEKVLINDEVFIIRNGEYYDALGRRRNKPEDRKK